MNVYKITHINFNQDKSMFIVCSNAGVKIYSIDPISLISDSGNIGNIALACLFYKYQVCALVGTETNIDFNQNKLVLFDNQSRKAIKSKIFKSQISSIKLEHNQLFLKVTEEINILSISLEGIELLIKLPTALNSPYTVFSDDSSKSNAFSFITKDQYISVLNIDKFGKSESIAKLQQSKAYSEVQNLFLVNFNDLCVVDSTGSYFKHYTIKNSNEFILNHEYYRGHTSAVIHSITEINTKLEYCKDLEIIDFFKKPNIKGKVLIVFSSNLTLHVFSTIIRDTYYSRFSSLFMYNNSVNKIRLFDLDEGSLIDDNIKSKGSLITQLEPNVFRMINYNGSAFVIKLILLDHGGYDYTLVKKEEWFDKSQVCFSNYDDGYEKINLVNELNKPISNDKNECLEDCDKGDEGGWIII